MRLNHQFNASAKLNILFISLGMLIQYLIQKQATGILSCNTSSSEIAMYHSSPHHRSALEYNPILPLFLLSYHFLHPRYTLTKMWVCIIANVKWMQMYNSALVVDQADWWNASGCWSGTTPTDGSIWKWLLQGFWKAIALSFKKWLVSVGDHLNWCKCSRVLTMSI